MQLNNITIFGIDNTLDSNWDLPFIRLGRYPFSSSILNDNIGDNISECQYPLDMINAIYWIYKNLQLFGNPSTIGVCHYRRFFTHSIQNGILPIKDKYVDNKYIATPLIQQQIILNNKVDGIITFPWYEDFFKNPQSKSYGIVNDYQYVWEGSYIQLKTDNVGLTLDEVKLAYDYLFNFSDDDLKPYIRQAFLEKTVHFCSIFTLNKPLFDLYCKTALKAVISAILDYDSEHLMNNCNCRVGGYLLERVGSCLFHALKLKGVKLMSMPIIETNYLNKPIYRYQTCKDVNMIFNRQLLLEKVNSI